MSQTYQTRPSELLAVHHPLTAFYLDRVIMNTGSQIEGEIEAAQKRKKSEKSQQMAAQLVLNRWLRAEGGARYRDPAAR